MSMYAIVEFIGTENEKISGDFSLFDITKKFTNISWPKNYDNIDNEFLKTLGVYPVDSVYPEQKPDNVYKIYECTSKFQNDRVVNVFRIVDAPESHIIHKISILARQARIQRNQLLKDSDWTQVLDNPFSDEEKQSWRGYRQALRDITDQSSFPIDIEWPQKPI